jgi:transposase-like protein
MRQTRRHFSVSQKAQIVRRHLSGKEPVSNLADEFGLQPSQIHTWVKQVLDQAEHALERPAGRPPRVEQLQAKLVERLQTKLVEKNEVIAELMQEHVQLKKELGEP